MGNVTVRDSTGAALDVPEEQLQAYVARGYQPETGTQQAERLGAEHRTEEYGGPVGTFAAAGLGALGTVTGGLSDAALAGAGGGDVLRALKEENPTASTVGAIGGAFIPTGLAGLAGRAGAGVAEGVGGLAGKALAGVTEGAIYGAGASVTDLSLSQDPLTWERAASSIGSNVLYGGALGGGIGLATGAVERGLLGAKKLIDERLARHAVEQGAADAVAIAPEIAALDRTGLKAAREAEIESLTKATEPARKSFVEELDAYRNTNRDAHELREIARGSGDRDVVEAGSSFTRADMKLRKMLDVRAELAAQPERTLNILQQQEQALEEIRQWGARQKQLWQADVEAAPARIRREILAKQVPGELGPFTKEGLDLAVQRELASRSKLNWYADGKGPFAEGYALKEPAFVRHEADYQQAIDWNKRLQDRLNEIAVAPQSQRLAQIDAATAAMSAPAAPKTLGERLLHHVPGGALVSEIAGIGGKATGGIKAAIGKAAVRTGEAVSAFAGAAAPAVAKSTPLATKVLSELSYGAVANAKAPPATDLASLWRARTDEIKAQTAYDESGIPRVRPEARQAIASRLQPVRVANPILGDRLETLAVRRLEYLSSLIPRLPDTGGIHTGPTTQRPSDMAMRSWARSAAAVEDPGGIEERVVHGNVTPEDASAYWAVYPERARHFQQQIIAALPTAQKLPYTRRLSLGIFAGVVIDPSMHPRVLAVLQGQFPDEPGSAGGTQAPKASPQFGSIKESVDAPTAAQARSQGARV